MAVKWLQDLEKCFAGPGLRRSHVDKRIMTAAKNLPTSIFMKNSFFLVQT